jgi:hypothetical protein
MKKSGSLYGLMDALADGWNEGRIVRQRDMFGRMDVEIFIYSCVLCFAMHIEYRSENTRDRFEI